MNKKIIQWEKWRDPFGIEDSETDYPGVEEDATYIDEDSESIESGSKIRSFPSSAIQVMVALVGLLLLWLADGTYLPFRQLVPLNLYQP